MILGSCLIHWTAGSNVMRGGEGGVKLRGGAEGKKKTEKENDI